MDWTAKDAITKQIDEMLEKQTFSASAVEGIKKLRDRVAELEKENGALREVVADKTAKINDIDVKLIAAKEANAAWAARDAAITAREQTMTGVEQAKAVAEAKLQGFTGAMEMVFRNTIVRETKVGEVVRDSQYWNPGASGPNISPVKMQTGETTTTERS